jgi:hypothetical protein
MVCQSAGQENDEEIPRSMNEGTLLGFGTSNIKDTYLSPFNYNGWGARILNERMKTISAGKGRYSRQQIINVDITSTRNPAENVNDFGTFIDYSLSYHYRIPFGSSIKLLAGLSTHLMGGFIYNTRNGNNPLSAKVDIDLGISMIILYGLKVKDHPLTLRYQTELPFGGLFFSPPYGISYYEMFNEGNTSDVIAFNSFHNKFAVKNYLTVDIPIRHFTLRLGYLNSLYYSETNDINTHMISHSFMIGWVKEFIVLGGKRSNNKSRVNSSYY